MLAFDTHKFVKQLTGAGMATEQAEVLAGTYAELLTDRLATKDDVLAIRADFEQEFASVRKEMAAMEERMDLKLQAVEQRLERKIVNTGVINVVAICTIMGLLITVLT